MSFVRSTLVYLTLNILLCAVLADARRMLQHGEAEVKETTNVECLPPPDGDWMSRHNFPSAPGNNTLVQQIRTLVSLRRVDDNVYQGFAGGVVSTPEAELFLPGPIQFNVVAIWDPESCTLSGAIVNHEEGASDPFELIYDGETLSGPYSVILNSEVLFTHPGILSLSLVYPY